MEIVAASYGVSTNRRTGARTFENRAEACNYALSVSKARWIKFVQPGQSVTPAFIGRLGSTLKALENEPTLVAHKTLEKNGRSFYQGKHDPFGVTRVLPYARMTATLRPFAEDLLFRRDLVSRRSLTFRSCHDDSVLTDFASRYLAADVLGGGTVLAFADTALTSSVVPVEQLHVERIVEQGYGEDFMSIIERLVTAAGPENNLVSRAAVMLMYTLCDALLKSKKADDVMSEESRRHILGKLGDIARGLGRSRIWTTGMPGYGAFQKTVLLALAGTEPAHVRIVLVDGYDAHEDMVRLRYFSEDAGFESVWLGERETLPRHARSIRHHILGQPVCTERLLWVSLAGKGGELRFEAETGTDCKLSMGGKSHARIAVSDIHTFFNPAKLLESHLPVKTRILRYLATRAWTRSAYKDVWVITDRDDGADDNAEHFYRYLLRERSDINARFLLSKKSADWKRLQHEGFRLLPFGGLRHRLALINAEFIISSQANPSVVSYLPKKHYADLMNSRLVFLQHGITKDDQSQWLNSRDIRLLVTAARDEFDDISANGRYKYSDRETILTGFPRHDALLASPSQHDLVLIMPTWRKHLSGELLHRSSRRAHNPRFAESEFATRWSALLNSDELRRLHERNATRLVFFPHPNLREYLGELKVPSYIEVPSASDGSLQALFRDAGMLVTDYSSVAFDVAYLGKPVAYLQFDVREFFAGHSYSRGYYDYERDGFGPVFMSEAALAGHIADMVSSGFSMQAEYQRRVDRFFAYRDGRASERICQRIEALKQSSGDVSDNTKLAIEQARNASRFGRWELALKRWETVEKSCDDAPSRREAVIHMAQARRELGDVRGARALLDTEIADSDDHIELLFSERAELAELEGDWDTAIDAWRDMAALRDESPARLRLVQAYRSVGDLLSAQLELAKISTWASDSEAYRIQEAALAASVENWEASARIWSELIVNPRICLRVEDRVFASVALEKIGDVKAARAVLAPAERDASPLLAVRVRRAELDFAQRRWKAVEAAWTAITQESGYHLAAEHVFQLAVAQRMLKKRVEARASFQALRVTGYQSWEADCHFCGLLYQEKAWDEIVASFDFRAVDPGAEHAIAFLHKLGTACAATGRIADARVILALMIDAQLATRDAEGPRAYLCARLAMESREWETAAHCWSALLEKYPEAAPKDALRQLLVSLRRLQDSAGIARALYMQLESMVCQRIESRRHDDATLARCADLLNYWRSDSPTTRPNELHKEPICSR
ncbi:CDP-glycerol glycerophosphotransferase family protein [Caballeronia sp. INDeC2]|uniref:CDP-glycerol glycerophosphotransferase family protein n=1 Tax=Caballeronia sp. INDeC2 TaxID=2921747 RepID=UPI00202945A5